MKAGDNDRYSRQILFHGIGEEGQQRIVDARVAIVGCGALGSFQAGALARAGVGHLTIIDRDYVELSNLQRQWLFDESDVTQALPKAVAAANHLSLINRNCVVEPIVADLTPQNIDDLLEHSHLILDGTDNFETRYLLNDFAVKKSIPWIYGAAVGSYGLSMPVVPGLTGCLSCVYPKPPDGAQQTCETVGVLGPLTSLIASIQCADALRILAVGTAGIAQRITTADVWTGSVRQIRQPAPDPQCVTCGLRQFPHLLASSRAPISLCGRNAVQIHERARPINLVTLHADLERIGEVRSNEFALRFFAPPYEMTVFPDGRAIIKGTTDVGVARSLYARYVGN